MGCIFSKNDVIEEGILTKQTYRGKATCCQNIFALMMKKIIKDSITSISMETLQFEREKFAKKELPAAIK